MVRTSEIEPQNEVDAAKSRLRMAVQKVKDELEQTAESLQTKVVDTVQEVQDRVQDTTSQIEGRVSSVVNKPADFIRDRPLESLAVSLVAGFVVGLLSKAPKAKASSSSYQAASNASGGMLSGLVTAGVGKMVWDAVREEYLTPSNIRNLINSVVGGSRDHQTRTDQPT